MSNILFINTSDCVGGAAKVAWNLGHHLNKTYSYKYITYEKKSFEKYVYKIPEDLFVNLSNKISGGKFTNLIKHYKAFILSNDIDFGYGWKHLIKNDFFVKSDIVHLHNLHGSYFDLNSLVKISKPMVWTLHDEWSIMPHGAWSTRYDQIDRFYKRDNLISYPPMLINNENYLKRKKLSIYSQISPVIVTPSKWLQKKLTNSVLADKKIKLIPNGIDTRVFKPMDKDKLRSKYKLPKNKKIILSLSSGGSGNPQKGWEHTQKIINDLKNQNILFVSVGSGSVKSRHDEGIHYIPYITNEELVAEFYALSDLFLFTSNHENFPLTILESLSCGLPVAAFDVGGIKEQIVDGKNGFVSDHGDFKVLEAKIVSYLRDNNRVSDQFSAYSREFVCRYFSLESMVDRYQQLYKSLLK